MSSESFFRKSTKIHGFNIVELMVALLLSTLLAVGLTQLVTATKQAYLLSSARTAFLESINNAVSVLTNTVTFSDHPGLDSQDIGCFIDNVSDPVFKKTLGTALSLKDASLLLSGVNPNQYVYKFFGQKIAPNSQTGDYVVDNSDNPYRYGIKDPGTCSADDVHLQTVVGSQNRYIPFYLNGVVDANSNDTLYVRYEGEKDAVNSTIFDCLGNPVDGNTLVVNTFKIQKDTNNNSYLACSVWSYNYMTQASSTQAFQKIADNVEVFKVLFGIDTDFDGSPNKYVDANYFKTGTTSLPNSIVSSAPQVLSNAENHKVVSVMIGMLMSSENITSVPDTKTYDILGQSYGPFNDNRLRVAYNLTLKPNACLPKSRTDCIGAPISTTSFKITGFGGFITANQTIWYSQRVPATYLYKDLYCGCRMNADGGLIALRREKGGGITEGNVLPYYSSGASAVESGEFFGCSCYFK